MSEELTNIISPVAGIITVVIGITLAYAITKLASFWQAKRKQIESDVEANFKGTKLYWISYLIKHLFNIIDSVVKSLNDTWKKEMLEASKDGKLTEDEKKKLLDKAVNLVKVEIPDSAWEEISEVVGDIDEFVRTKIENSISLQKIGKTLSEDVENYNS